MSRAARGTAAAVAVVLLWACSGALSEQEALERALERARSAPRGTTVSESPTSSIRVSGTRKWETILPPTPLRGAGGLACREGRVLVTELLAGRLSAVSADGSVTAIQMPRGFSRPTDLAVDEAGVLFASTQERGGIWRRDPDGRWRRLPAVTVDAAGLVAKAGSLFVTECAEGGRLVRIDLARGDVPRVLATDLGCPGRPAIDESGSLVVPLRDRGTVIALDPESRVRTTLAKGLDHPAAVGRTPDGALVVLEGGSGRIRSLARPAGQSAEGQPAAGTVVARLLPGIADLIVCGETVIVSNEGTGGMLAFKPWPGSARTLTPDGLVVPTGLAFDGPDLVVADRASIKRIRNGTIEIVAVAGADAMPSPAGLAGGVPGIVWATAPEAGELLQVDLGRGESTRIVSGLDWPTSVLRTDSGDLVVAETGAGRIVQLGMAAVPYTLASGLMSPVGLATRGQRILTAEPGGGRVLSIRADSAPTVLASGLAAPAGLATERRQPLYVAEESRGAVVAHSADGTEHRIAEGLALRTGPADGQLPVPLIVAPDGWVVIASPEDGSVVRISPN